MTTPPPGQPHRRNVTHTPSAKPSAVVTFALAGLGMIGPFSIDTPLPAFAQIQTELHASVDATQQLVAGYMLAFALMSVVHGPLSDALGRRPVILGSLLVYLTGAVGCALAPNIGVLIACRVIQGMSAGASTVLSRTMVRDLYSGADAQRLMSRIMIIFALAPALAPVVGGWLSQAWGWRSCFWFLTLVALALMALVITAIPETLPPSARSQLRPRALAAGLITAGRSLPFARVAWTSATAFGGYFMFIGSAAIIMSVLLHESATDYWKLFVPLIAGNTVGAIVSERTAGRLSSTRLITGGLAVALVGALLGLALALGEDTARMPYAVIGPFVLAIGTGAANPAIQLAAVDLVPQWRGAAMSVVTFVGLFLNAITSGAVAPLVTGSLAHLQAFVLALEVIGALLWSWHLVATRQARRSRPRRS